MYSKDYGSSQEEISSFDAGVRDRPLLLRMACVPELNRLLNLETGRIGLDDALGSVMACALVGHADGHDVSFSLNRNKYVGGIRYGGPGNTYKHVKAATEHLERIGLIEVNKGKTWKDGGRGRQSILRATPLAIEQAAPFMRFRRRPGETIVLKDASKALIDYRETARTIRERADIAQMQEAISGSDIRIEHPGIEWNDDRVMIPTDGGITTIRPETQNQLYRVFNNGAWSQGGRFYGHWIQSLPKAVRSSVTINGGKVGLLDYSASHPRILYAQADAPLESDPYEVVGVARKVVKLAMLILLNCTTKKGAVQALATHMPPSDAILGERLREARTILEAIEARHQSIARSFYSGAGLACQRTESDILGAVMKRALVEGVVTLPVHDEIVCPAAATSRVRELMVAAWVDKLGAEPVVG